MQPYSLAKEHEVLFKDPNDPWQIWCREMKICEACFKEVGETTMPSSPLPPSEPSQQT